MDRSSYGSTAELISKITDPNQLQQMLKNPQYAGFTGVIIARLTEINRMHQAQQAQQPPAPTVAQQALAGQPPQAQQAMAKGGIVSFKHGGKVRKFDKGGSLGHYTYAALAPDEVAEDPEAPTNHAGMEHSTATSSRYPNSLEIALAADKKHRSDAMAIMQANAKRQASLTPAGANAPTPVAAAPQPDAQPKDTTPPNQKDFAVDASGGIGGGYSARNRGADLSGVHSVAQNIADLRGDAGNEDAANLKSDRAAILENQRQNPNMALMAAGLNMAHDASVNPHSGFLGNAAAGGISGLGYYTQQGDQQANQLRDLNKVSRQENQAVRTAAVQEHGQDVRAASMNAAQAMYAKAMLSKGALDEQDIRNYAMARAQEDAARGIHKPPAMYIMEAKKYANSISSGMQIAGVNTAQRESTATVTGWNNYQKNNGPVPFERYQQMISANQPDAVGAESSPAGGGSGNIIGTYPGAQ